ncbi:MAG: phosphoesterase, partial [Ginsengibacter sp.]
MKSTNIEVVFKIVIVFSFLFTSCKSTRVFKSTVTSDDNYHSSYDDTTLTPDNSAILMPYNRFIDPAGTVIGFGNPSLENHSLDCVVLPGGKILAVEDRYGVAFINISEKKILFHLDYSGDYSGFMSTYSGIKTFEDEKGVHVLWGAANPNNKISVIMEATWDGEKATIQDSISFAALSPAPMSLPNDIAIKDEDGEKYLYVVLNGNSQLCKVRLSDKKIIWTTATGMAPFGIALSASKAYVTNWAGPVPTDASKETAGIPYGEVYIDPRTGATSTGSVSIIDLKTGSVEKELKVGLHPNAVISSKDGRFIYVSNGNSGYISVINTQSGDVVDSISVKLNPDQDNLIGDSPNALALDDSGNTLYVANGMDNALAVVSLGKNASTSGEGVSHVKGFIPTEAYPAGLQL